MSRLTFSTTWHCLRSFHSRHLTAVMISPHHPRNPSTYSPLPGVCVPSIAGTHAELLVRIYDCLYAEKRTARPCVEQGRKQAPSSTKNEVEAVAAAKWARTWVIYTRYAPTCIYIYYLHYFLCARSKRGSRRRRRRNKVEAVAAAKWLRTYEI